MKELAVAIVMAGLVMAVDLYAGLHVPRISQVSGSALVDSNPRHRQTARPIRAPL